MVDPSILKTQAFKLIQEGFFQKLRKVHIMFVIVATNVNTNKERLDTFRYATKVFDKCHTGKSEWICKSCDKVMRKNKMPAQAYSNDLEPCHKIQKLDNLYALEITLISQMIPFMFLVGKVKGTQRGLKGQRVLVPADVNKIQATLPRFCNDEYINTLALKRRLTDKNAFHKEHIRPALVSKALNKLKDINPLYKNIVIEDS